jgi:hypothetical protein
MQVWISIIFSLIFAWCCSNHARRLGKNPIIWLVLGALFGIFAFLALVFIGLRKPVKKTAPAAPLVPTPVALSPSHAEKFWYYLNNNKEQFGPMSFQGLGKAWKEGAVSETTFVWNEEMENWQHFKDVVTVEQR